MKEKIKGFLRWPWFYKKYTEEQWEEEKKAPPVILFLPRENITTILGSVLPCPKCKKIGFYAAREDNSPPRGYRMCKFCGFEQEAWGDIRDNSDYYGGKPYRCKHFYCNKCKKIETYYWTMPTCSLGRCKKCGAENKRTKWASDDPNHPFRKLKEVRPLSNSRE